MKKFLLFLFIYSSITNLTLAVSPKNNNWWVFGQNAAIDFNNSTATEVNGKPLVTYDNTSSICTDNGRLLFYTNGEIVWDSTDTPMPNGTGLFGNVTGGQTALIVPVPDNSIYYIFTVPEFGSGGLYYSIVDMTLNNGLGDITTKNAPLNNPSTEKLAAYYDETHARFWVITHEYGNNTFNCYTVDSHGLDTIPVVSMVGSDNTGGSYGYDHGAMGQVAISQDGAHLVNALEFDGAFELFDFDTQTGTISNPVTLTGQPNAWGAAFSPDGLKLYTTQWTYSGVAQYDLSVFTQSAIMASQTSVGTATGAGSYNAGYLQLAPDGKIYIARYGVPFLATISFPDSSGAACSFSANGFNLGTGFSRVGLSSILVYPGAFTSIAEINSHEVSSVVYPNPSQSEFTISLKADISLKATIQFFDVLGQNVKMPYTLTGNSFEVKTKGLARGSYEYLITDKEKVSRGRVILN